MSAIWRRSWPSMSAISITGVRIARLDNVRPAHRRHLRRIEALKLERSLRYRCLEVSITFISGPHDVLDQILAPYRGTGRSVDVGGLGRRRPCWRAGVRRRAVIRGHPPGSRSTARRLARTRTAPAPLGLRRRSTSRSQLVLTCESLSKSARKTTDRRGAG